MVCPIAPSSLKAGRTTESLGFDGIVSMLIGCECYPAAQGLRWTHPLV